MVTWRFEFGCTIVLIVVQAGNSKVLAQKSNSQFSKTKVNTEPRKMYVEIYNNDIYMWDVHISKAAGKIPFKKHVSSL